MATVTAEMLRKGRDLADLDAELKAERDGLIFMETSKPQPIITLYAMSDGEPIPMPAPIAAMAIKKRYRGGGYMFTDKPEEAPVYKLGNVKCFLHADSPERASGALDEVGIASVICPAEHLASKYSRRVHAENRHGKRWQAYQEHMAELKNQEWERRQDQQLEATLALAGRAAQNVQKPLIEMDASTNDTFVNTMEVRNDCGCGWVNEKNTAQGLAIHKRLHCPQREGANDAGSPPLDEA